MFLNLENTRYMQYVGALSATLSNTAMGMYATWASPALSILQSEDSPLGRPIDHEEGSWIVSLPKLAAVPASIIGGWLVEKIGRKHSLLIAGILLFLPWLMIIFGTSIWILYAARFIAGLGNGVVIIGCSIYNAEIAENDIRGKLGSIAIVLRLVGSLLTLSVGPHVSYTVLAIISATVPVIFICIYFFMPESPYYLVKAKKPEEAEKSLRILSSKSVSDKFFKERIMEIEQSIEEDMRNKTTLWEFFSNANYRRAIYIMIGITTLQQLSGVAAINSYMQSIIASTGSNISEETSSMIFGFIPLPGALLASYLVDKIGRKPLLMISAAGCAVALFAEGTYFYFQNVIEADVSAISWMPTFGIGSFIFMVNLGIVTLPYVLLGELFPVNIKGIAASATTFYGASLAFIVSKLFKPLSNAWGEYTIFWIFGTACALGVIFVLIMLPETRGKSFSEIQAILRNESKESDIES